jgi:hypothetical protein
MDSCVISLSFLLVRVCLHVDSCVDGGLVVPVSLALFLWLLVWNFGFLSIFMQVARSKSRFVMHSQVVSKKMEI